jgi:hypothetical protein
MIMRMNKIYPGKYQILKTRTTGLCLTCLNTGNHVEVKIRLGNNVFPNEIFGAFGRKFEADSVDFEKAVYNTTKFKSTFFG